MLGLPGPPTANKINKNTVGWILQISDGKHLCGLQTCLLIHDYLGSVSGLFRFKSFTAFGCRANYDNRNQNVVFLNRRDKHSDGCRPIVNDILFMKRIRYHTVLALLIRFVHPPSPILQISNRTMTSPVCSLLLRQFAMTSTSAASVSLVPMTQ